MCVEIAHGLKVHSVAILALTMQSRLRKEFQTGVAPCR